MQQPADLSSVVARRIQELEVEVQELLQEVNLRQVPFRLFANPPCTVASFAHIGSCP